MSDPSYRMASYIAEFYSDVIPVYAKGKLLDLGCGNVPMFEFYKDYVSNVICVDWGSSLHDLSHLDYECDLNKKLAIEENSFETIICSDVLEHLHNPENLFLEANRLLKPKGFLLLNFPFLYGIHEVPYDYFRYTEFAIRRFAEGNKFKIVKTYSYGDLIDVLEHALLRILKLIPYSGWVRLSVSKGFVPIGKGIFSRRLEKTNHHPYMYGFVLQKL